MKYLTIIFLSLVSGASRAQVIDTMINAGKYNLHFTIIPGKGTPILFESGGGNDGSIWKGITQPVAEAIGATVITYDRPGLGKSGIDSTDTRIENDLTGLETALGRLGFRKDIMLVAHSLGGFYNTLYVADNPGKVKAIIFIDANLPCFFTDDLYKRTNTSQQMKNTVEHVKENPVPDNIPLLDIVSEKTLFEGTPDADRWKACHFDFANASPNRKELIALGTGHYIFLQNRQLVINGIISMYAYHVMPGQKMEIIERGYAEALNGDNDDHKKLMNYWHSEDDFNEWGYSFLQKNQFEKAIEIFKLNVLLHPESANVYDSLGDALARLGDKEQAIDNYKKALAIDPQKKSAKKALEQLMK